MELVDFPYHPESTAVVPGGYFDPSFDPYLPPDIDSFPPPPLPPSGPLQKPPFLSHVVGAHAAVPVKPEPNSHGFFDFAPRPQRAYWPLMDGQFTPGGAGQQPPLPLSISQPPTPGAECLVSSTLSPLASPFSPRSDEGSFELAHLDTQPMDMGDVNIKGLTEEQLVSLTARDLNRICRDLPDDVIKQLKKRRRTLKNRGYAYNSRVRRVSQKNTLEKERDELKLQVAQLSDRVRSLSDDRNQWKRRAQALERGDGAWSPNKSS